jgi:hypothetical protein
MLLYNYLKFNFNRLHYKLSKIKKLINTINHGFYFFLQFLINLSLY